MSTALLQTVLNVIGQLSNSMKFQRSLILTHSMVVLAIMLIATVRFSQAQESLLLSACLEREVESALCRKLDLFNCGDLEAAEKHFTEAAKHRGSNGVADYYLA